MSTDHVSRTASDDSACSHPSRRRFLQTSAGLAALAALGACADPSPAPKPEGAEPKAGGPDEPPFKISLAEWSYHDALFKKTIDHKDFAKVARETHGIRAVEYVNTFFKEQVKDAAYVKELKTRADDLGVRILLIMCDGEGDLGHADKVRRLEAVENHKKWLEAARVLGCHSIRVNAYGGGTPEEHMTQAADGLRTLAELASPLALNVIVENHGGHSSNGAWLAGVMKKADHPRVGTLPDFGNFDLGEGKQYDRYQGVTETMPWAKAVSAKCYDFDAKGDETTIDFRRMLKIVTAAKYHGHLGIEYEGSRLSEKDGVEAMRILLERIRGEMS